MLSDSLRFASFALFGGRGGDDGAALVVWRATNGSASRAPDGAGPASGSGDPGGSGGTSGNGDDGRDGAGGNASANNGRGGNYGRTGHDDNGHGNGVGRR